VLGLDYHDGAPGSDPFVQGVGNLGTKALLELGTAGVGFHHPGQLGEADDLAFGNVTDVGLADQGQEMVFTGAVEGYVADEDHLVVVFLEPDGKLPSGIYVQSGEEELVSPRYPRGRIPESFPLGVLPYSEQYLLDGALDPGPSTPRSGG